MIKKLSQGEIFGLALVFVLIVLGIIIYAQYKALNPSTEKDIILENKYKIISESTLNSILKLSTGCYVERGRDTVKDLVNYCLEGSFSGSDPLIFCDSYGTDVPACQTALSALNQSLFIMFTQGGVGEIPYYLIVDVPRESTSLLSVNSHDNFSNFGTISLNGDIVDIDNYRNLGFKRVSSGLKTWPTAQGNVEFELQLFYK